MLVDVFVVVVVAVVITGLLVDVLVVTVLNVLFLMSQLWETLQRAERHCPD